MTVAELDARISSRELSEWMAYETVTGPLAHRRGDIQAATVAAVVANSQKSKRAKKSKISDFVIDYDKRRRGRSAGPHELLAKLRSATRRMGGTVGEKGGRGGDD